MGYIVVDNSALLPLFLPDELDEFPNFVLQQSDDGEVLCAPSICLLEFGQGILKAVRRGRLTEADVAAVHRVFASLPIDFYQFGEARDIPAIHALAQRRRLTFYDATYLNLALSQGARLASLDEALKAAALAEGVTLV